MALFFVNLNMTKLKFSSTGITDLAGTIGGSTFGKSGGINYVQNQPKRNLSKQSNIFSQSNPLAFGAELLRQWGSFLEGIYVERGYQAEWSNRLGDQYIPTWDEVTRRYGDILAYTPNVNVARAQVIHSNPINMTVTQARFSLQSRALSIDYSTSIGDATFDIATVKVAPALSYERVPPHGNHVIIGRANAPVALDGSSFQIQDAVDIYEDKFGTLNEGDIISLVIEPLNERVLKSKKIHIFATVTNQDLPVMGEWIHTGGALSQDDMTNLATSPFVLIQPPPSGFFITNMIVSMYSSTVVTPYDFSNVELRSTNDQITWKNNFQFFINQPQGITSNLVLFEQQAPGDINDIDGQGLYLWADVNPTQGDAEFQFEIAYKISQIAI